MTRAGPKPVDIAHHVQRNALVVEWDDGQSSELGLEYLRGWCPCAGCQGHDNTIRWLGEQAVSAVDLEEVGAYALLIRFSDGHDTGIYRWTWLRTLCPTEPPLGPKRGVYKDGRFQAASS